MEIIVENINWFSKAGQFIDPSLILIPIQQARNENEYLKSINSLKWENFVLYASNRLSWYIQSFYENFQVHWNDVAKMSRDNYEAIKPKVQRCALECNIPNEVLPDTRGIIIFYFIEKYYLEQIGNSIPQQFNKLMSIYAQGNIPCGWVSKKMPENEGYDPVNFEEGKILVW